MTIDDTIMNPFDWYKAHDINLIIDDPVEHVNREGQYVVTSKGLTVSYDICIFATGSSAFVLPIPGADLPSVIGWRTIKDTNNDEHKRKTCRRYWRRSSWIRMCAWIIRSRHGSYRLTSSRLVDGNAIRCKGALLKADLEQQGMKIELQANSQEIIGQDDVEAIKLADGRVIETDLIVMAVGIRPYVSCP